MGFACVQCLVSSVYVENKMCVGKYVYGANVFDKYDPPNKSDAERLAHIEKAKLAQAKVQESI